MQRREVLALGALPLLPACAAVAQDQALRTIGFASCFDQTRPQDLVAHMAAQPFDLFIFGGDNVYFGTPRHGSLRSAYAAASALPAYTALRARPHMAVWDDNDYSGGDGGADFALKQDSKDQFLAFWQVAPGDERRSREGLYDSRVFGPAGQQVQVIVLDTRWFRSPLTRKSRLERRMGEGGYVPDPDPAKTLLGPAQWAWLARQLRVPADLRIIVSSIQVLAEGHSYERWGNLPAEREKLLAMINAAGARNTVILSGDRHFAALYERTRGLAHPLTELTSSGVTHVWPSPTDVPADALARLTEMNYGTLDIDWQRRQVTVAARNLQGDKRIARTLSIGERT